MSRQGQQETLTASKHPGPGRAATDAFEADIGRNQDKRQWHCSVKRSHSVLTDDKWAKHTDGQAAGALWLARQEWDAQRDAPRPPQLVVLQHLGQVLFEPLRRRSEQPAAESSARRTS